MGNCFPQLEPESKLQLAFCLLSGIIVVNMGLPTCVRARYTQTDEHRPKMLCKKCTDLPKETTGA